MSDMQIDSMVTITGAEYEALRAENERLRKMRRALWDIHAICNNGPLVRATRIKTIARVALKESE